ncbi:MAG: DUF3488 domain-containing protein, partial [Clostridiales bacterium]|nr:DUF3488 domain-containing protein [Clostridiales bacterium]
MGMALSAVVLSLLLTAVPREEFEASPRTYAIRDDLIGAAMNLESLRLFQGLSGFTSGSPLTSSNGTVDLNSAGRIRFADRDVMRVYTDTPQNLYLRGYSASVYTGSQWLQEDPGAYEAYGVDIDPNTYMNAVAADYYGGVQPITVRVEFLQRSSNFLFTAYQLAETDGAGTWSGD